ncbi:MAG: glycosyltransferase [Rhodospirillum sp.]|nr:glycosyltransferase [Rhodospirillum sp.]MCF8491788.1 glycosyltransferase [Rhodospirillum sp.]MCF8503099.1 glycosyltransferase [Rhodospirillum sp.]
MIRQPVVSVIIPNRNRVGLVLRTLFSVARQTAVNVECLVVDDGSREDMSPVRAMLEAMGGRFLDNTGTPGAAGARVLGVEAARGRHVAFLDSDDWMFPEKLAVQRAMALSIEAKGGRPALGCGMAFLKGGHLFGFQQPDYKRGTAISEFLYAQGGLFQTSSFYLSRDLALDVPFDTALPVHQDTDLMMRLLAAGAHIAVAPDMLVAMDADPRAERITVDPSRLEASRQWYEERKATWSRAARKGFLRRDLAFRLAHAGRHGEAILCYAMGLEAWPSPRELLKNGLILALGEGRSEALRRGLARFVKRGNRMPPDDPMLGLVRADERRVRAILAGELGMAEALGQIGKDR